MQDRPTQLKENKIKQLNPLKMKTLFIEALTDVLSAFFSYGIALLAGIVAFTVYLHATNQIGI